ncbi:MAG: N-acetylmuramoyl-L-alanine amidase [Erysipelotrichaceae bacterium]|nr:N-acetylmuramoyl-L-alanine amidase [Erysipelotrichaceae bacterium]
MAKKKRKMRKIRWKNVIIALIALGLTIYLLSWVIGLVKGLFKPKDTSGFTACNLTNAKLSEKFTDKEYQGWIEMSDYVFYGENLTFYTETYTPDVANAFVGKTLVLVDVCTGNEIVLDKVEDRLDGQFDVSTIPAGFYEVYMEENLVRKRLYTNNKFETDDEPFYTVTRNGMNKKIEVFADKALLNKDTATEDVLKDHFVFINVTEEVAPEGYYDIMLNPGPLGITNTESATGNGVTEASELYQFAVKVKNGLEEKGYRVALSRDGGEALSTYGEGGTVAAGFDKQVKYLIDFGMYEASAKAGGMYVTYSSYVKNTLAKSIYDAISEGTPLTGTDLSKSARRGVYDSDFDIREAGGLALGAGTYSDAEKVNEFAATNRHGMECVCVEFINTKNATDAQNWLNNTDLIVEKTVEGIAAALARE